MKFLVLISIALPLFGLSSQQRVIYTGDYGTRDPYQGGRLSLSDPILKK